MFLLRRPGAGQSDIADFALITSSAVNQTVKKIFDERGITMTYPHLNVHLDK